jgi:hypothetical protein
VSTEGALRLDHLAPVRYESWMTRGACRGCAGIDFFPAPGDPGLEAKAVCVDCSVQVACLDHALLHRELGIWGGTTGRERSRIRRQRRVSAAAQPLSPP